MTLSNTTVDSSFVLVGTAQVLPLSHPSSVASRPVSRPRLWRLSTHNDNQSPDTTGGMHIHGRHTWQIYFIDACSGGPRVQYPWGKPPWGLQEVRPLVNPKLAALLFLRCVTYITVSLMVFLRQSCATLPLPRPIPSSPFVPLTRG